jgi:selenocysteine-specific elongation factor
VKPDIVYPVARLRRLEERLVALAGESGGELTLPGVRDELATSRKYAQALLEHLDAAGLTVRHGDRHVLRRPGERR